ncbi:MAG: hypothetical protein AAGA95_13890, partial [Pseudomonadota bacterium]
NSTAEHFALAVEVALKAAQVALPGVPVNLSRSSLYRSDSTTFNHAHLQNLGLIEHREGKWDLTNFGEGFIQAVSDPSLEVETGDD